MDKIRLNTHKRTLKMHAVFGRVRFFLFIIIMLSAVTLSSYGAKMSLYGKKETVPVKEREVSKFSLFHEKSSETYTDGAGSIGGKLIFELYGAEPLKAPPGGGDPVGGVTPVSDAYWLLFLLGTCYGIVRVLKKR